jgi:hypothetical protein
MYLSYNVSLNPVVHVGPRSVTFLFYPLLDVKT